ncbi:mannosylglycerate hydrolase [Tannockella kyphosi]|uniref:mannosylglycerate hydrolase n=1 Tax=Tannockella kyphosi TaxID=2899121 RepID=UPI0020134A4C|nr:mannosylglycerate hydrolase [Tannockella kyphosi]
MSNKVHVVPHMHWDREWYFSAEESKLLLVNNMEEIMTRLENDPNYPTYTLDGQTAVLEDYLNIMPENKERLKKLTQAGRLIIGPWYSQTDEMVVGGESIVRNLLYGHKDCEEFGPVMKLGYLPDSFGQSAQMPMILNGFDIHRSMFWRGTSERMGTTNTEFYWTSDDGSKVLTQLLPLGYAIGKYLPEEKEALAKRCEKYMPVLERGATGENILLPNGHDQMPIQQNIEEVMVQLKNIYPTKDFFLSSFDNLFEELEKKTDYDTLHGEFLDGKYMRVHRSIFSSRADIKILNTIIENKITNILEPLASLAYSLGFEYYHGFIESIWKDIMKNHAHDSIGCCCSDKVHREIKERFILALEKVDRFIEFYQRKIVDSMDNAIALDKLTVFNMLPTTRKEVVIGKVITRMKGFKLVDSNNQEVAYTIETKQIIDAGLIDRQIVHYGNYDPFVEYTLQIDTTIPSMGYTTFFLVEDTCSMEVTTKQANHLENEYYVIEVANNGTLTILDKTTNKEYSDVLLMEDGSDDGDGYDYSPLIEDVIFTSNDVIANTTINATDLTSKAIINYTMEVPKNLQRRSEGFIDATMDFSIEVGLKKNSDFISIQITVDNKAEDHRLRTYIPQNIAGKVSLSDNQFGIIERPVYDDALDYWEKEKWSERPDTIYPMLSYVTLKDASLVAFTNSIREYEVIGDNYETIALTLFRSVGVLGKENLVRRPGRPSGIKMETPDSQMLGTITMDLGISTYASTNELATKAKAYTTPLVSYNKMPYNAMKLNNSGKQTPYTHSLFTQTNKNIVISTVKKMEKEEQLLVRAFQITKEEQTIELNVPIKKVTNLNEETIDSNNNIAYNQVKSFII